MTQAPLIREADIATLRVRPGLLGRPVLQLRRARQRVRLVAPPDQPQALLPLTPGPWRDARFSDLPDIQQFLTRGNRDAHL